MDENSKDLPIKNEFRLDYYTTMGDAEFKTFLDRLFILYTTGKYIPSSNCEIRHIRNIEVKKKGSNGPRKYIPQIKNRSTTFGEGRVGMSYESYGVKYCFCDQSDTFCNLHANNPLAYNPRNFLIPLKRPSDLPIQKAPIIKRVKFFVPGIVSSSSNKSVNNNDPKKKNEWFTQVTNSSIEQSDELRNKSGQLLQELIEKINKIESRSKNYSDSKIENKSTENRNEVVADTNQLIANTPDKIPSTKITKVYKVLLPKKSAVHKEIVATNANNDEVFETMSVKCLICSKPFDDEKFISVYGNFFCELCFKNFKFHIIK